MATTTVIGDVQTGSTFQYTNRVILPEDVASTTSYADLTDLEFYAKAGNVYRFRVTVMTTALQQLMVTQYQLMVQQRQHSWLIKARNQLVQQQK
jgi:hypothetical protein